MDYLRRVKGSFGWLHLGTAFIISDNMMRRQGTKHCCWGLCKSDSRYPERLPEGTFFIPFPKPRKIRDNMTQCEREQAEVKTEKARRWQYLCGRADFQSLEKITSATYICSLHFNGGKGPGSDDDPMMAGTELPTTPAELNNQTACAPKRGRKRLLTEGSQELPGERSLDHNPDSVPSVFENDKKDKSCRKMDKACKKSKRDETEQCLSNITFSAGEDIEIEWPDLRVRHIELQEGYTDLQAKVDSLLAENDRLKEDLYLSLPRFSYTSLKGDDAQLMFLSGLHSLVFDWLLTQIAGRTGRLNPELNEHDHLLMVLMKLKLGLCDTDLCYRFRIQESSVTAICQTWIPAVAFVLKPLIAWPNVETVAKHRPSIFESKFSKCRGIIDIPEFIIAKTSDTAQENSTVRYFASVTPAGTVSFLSSGYSGDMSKNQIAKECGFLHLVDQQDEILSCKQIPIKDELASLGATLHTPDHGIRKWMPKSDLERIFWAHAKKVIGWWKDFNLLKKVVPEPYGNLLDDVLIVCAALTNVNLSVFPKANNNQQ